MTPKRIQEIEDLLSTVPDGEWHFFKGDDFDHWQIWCPHDGVMLVQDDAGVPPDPSFINFICHAKSIIKELLKEVK